MGGVKCQPFLNVVTNGNEEQKKLLRSGCFQLPGAVVTPTTKETYALEYEVYYKFTLFWRSMNCRLKRRQISIAKVSAYAINDCSLSTVALLTHTDATAINKLYMLHIEVFYKYRLNY